MKLPNVSNNLAVIALAAGIAIVTWVVIITAKAPNSGPPAKPAAAAAAPGNGESITYVDINMKDRAPDEKPAAPQQPH